MLPAFAYTIEPGTLYSSTSGGRTTTFDGAAVASAGASPLTAPVPPFDPPMKGTLLPSRLIVMKVTMSRPTGDGTGATHRPGVPAAADARFTTRSPREWPQSPHHGSRAGAIRSHRTRGSSVARPRRRGR